MERIQALNLAAYIVLAVIILLTAITAWAVIKDDKACHKDD